MNLENRVCLLVQDDVSWWDSWFCKIVLMGGVGVGGLPRRRAEHFDVGGGGIAKSTSKDNIVVGFSTKVVFI